MKLHTCFIITAVLFAINAPSQSRVPLDENQITLPDYFGIFAIDGTRPFELTKPMDDFNSEPSLEVSPSAEFVFYGVGQNRQLIRILSQEEYSQRSRRRDALANESFTWGNFNTLMNMQTADFVNSMNGLHSNEEAVQMLNKLVEGQPAMVRQIPASLLATGDYRIGDGSRWYKIRVVQSPNREIDDIASTDGATYEPVNYKKLASPTFIKDYDNKRVQFDAIFIGEWTLLAYYHMCKVSTSGKVFISHRHVGFTASETGLGSPDDEVPPFAISLPKDKSDIIYEMNRGDTFTAKGLAKKYTGSAGYSPGLEILVESLEIK